jgi:Tfp pilus assembly protein PilV
VIARVREESGWGLVELLMAMVLLNVGILAIVASFQAGAVALRRASETATAATLADAQLELYRAITYDSILLDDASVDTTDATYQADAATNGSVANLLTTSTTCAATECIPSRSVTGADKRTYRLDAYVTWFCASGTLGGTITAPTCTSAGTASRPGKLVTVVVRNGASPYKTLARQQSTFDLATGI